MQQCAAIAEIESEGSVENSLFDAPDGESHVKSTVVLFKGDPWVEGDKLCIACKKTLVEEGEKEGRGKNEEEGMGRNSNHRGTYEDTSPVGCSTDAGSTRLLLTTAATDASPCGNLGPVFSSHRP